jgi:hypothetical protein
VSALVAVAATAGALLGFLAGARVQAGALRKLLGLLFDATRVIFDIALIVLFASRCERVERVAIRLPSALGDFGATAPIVATIVAVATGDGSRPGHRVSIFVRH